MYKNFILECILAKETGGQREHWKAPCKSGGSHAFTTMFVSSNLPLGFTPMLCMIHTELNSHPVMTQSTNVCKWDKKHFFSPLFFLRMLFFRLGFLKCVIFFTYRKIFFVPLIFLLCIISFIALHYLISIFKFVFAYDGFYIENASQNGRFSSIL